MNEFAIVTEGLGKQFGKHWAVRNMNIKVPTGSVFGLLGPNGAGKSTTINMIMGLLPSTTGRISALGCDPVRHGLEIRARVGYVPEIQGFYDWMRINELVELVASYHDCWNWTLCSSLLAEFRLQGDAVIKNLSKGMRAKLSLLLALAFEPQMLVLDEPTGGLDPAARRNFIETILARFQETGRTILVSSHLVNEFSGLLDHVCFIREGNVELVTRLDELQRRMKRVRLVFAEQVPGNLRIEQALVTRVNGREAMLTCRDFNPQRTPEALTAQTGAVNVIVEDMTLEDIFVDLVGS